MEYSSGPMQGIGKENKDSSCHLVCVVCHRHNVVVVGRRRSRRHHHHHHDHRSCYDPVSLGLSSYHIDTGVFMFCGPPTPQ